MLNHSLSVVLPVYNAEHSVSAKVIQLLDILPDLTSNFELLVINDGSTDQTEEVLHDLTIVYPQVRVIRHRTRRGRQGAVETGLKQTSGEILLVQDENATIDSSKLHRLWALRQEEELLLEAESTMKRSMLRRLAAWGVRLEEATQEGGTAGVQMIRRRELISSSELEPTAFSEGEPKSSWTRHASEANHLSASAPKFRNAERARRVY